MENRNQTIGANGATGQQPNTDSPDHDIEAELDVIEEQIESLAEVDPAHAADRAVDVADRLARRLEEDDR